MNDDSDSLTDTKPPVGISGTTKNPTTRESDPVNRTDIEGSTANRMETLAGDRVAPPSTPGSVDSQQSLPDELKPSHVVGIGASAGGLPALQAIFDSIPDDTGAAFVVVQHLSPNFNTLMDELLARHSNMTVKLADDGEHLKQNHVYVMRPNRNIMVAEGRLFLNEIHRTTHPNLPIDLFFRSLAVDAQNRSVGIILSGTGSDGSHGVKSLREAGGLVMAQQPEEAEFSGMPVAAIRTGYVDAIGDIEELASQLISYIRHPLTASKNNAFRQHLAGNHDLLQGIFVKLKSATAIDFALYKPTTIARRIEHRMGINNIETLPAYADLLDRKPSEFDLLKSDLLIGVTQFFRDPDAYMELAQSVLPSIIESKTADAPIRVWMVGVSSGEEAYSLAIALNELLLDRERSIPVKIFASDADSDAIEFASAGVYPPNVQNDISEHRLHRFFNIDEAGNYVVNKLLRNMIVFATHNVLEDPPFSNMDLVVCRNMLIYLQTEAQERTIALFNFALRESGYLWLGSSESLGSQADSFSEFSPASKIWCKTRSSKIPIRHINPDYIRRASATTLAASSKGSHRLSQRYPRDQRNVYQSVRDRLLEEYGPDGILLSSNHQALHVFGNCGDYLGTHGAGRVTTHIDSLISPALVVPVSTCLARVAELQRTTYKLVRVPFQQSPNKESGTDTPLDNSDNASQPLIDITARRLTDLSRTDEVYFLILFSKADKPEYESGMVPAEKSNGDEQYLADTHTRERLRELDLQLIDSQQELRNAYAELDTTSEELQATNEELMAANEELQSTNEELQSVNEELYSVNTEYQEKIAELMELNTDLDNLLISTGYGIIFLDSTLAIRRFTPKMAKFINLLPGDIERPITDFKLNIEYPTLIKDIHEVLDSGEPIQKQTSLSTNEGSVSVNISPYISSDKTINGVVITTRE